MERKVKPVSAADITIIKEDLIPDAVIEAFNELIVEKWNGSRSHFKKTR
jgi:hypothetical protein